MKTLYSLVLALVLLGALTGCGGGNTQSAEIVEITCQEGLAMDVHILIKSPQGIQSYSIWSTWGDSATVEESFTEPYPTKIDKVVHLEHAAVDSEPDRDHQLGLNVIIPRQAETIFVYALEPDNRCPGH